MIKKEVGTSTPYAMIKSSMLISCVMIVAKLVSFVRDMLLAQNLGASNLSDIFLTSSSMLLVLTTFIRAPFTASYLPIATDYYYKKSKEEQNHLFGSVYGLAIVAGIVFTILEIAFLTPLINAIVPGFSHEAVEKLRVIVVIQLPILLCSFILAVNSGNLKLLNKFGVSEISEILIQLFCVIYLFFAKDNTNINYLSVAVVIGYCAAVAVQYISILHSGIKPKINFDFFHNEGVRIIIRAMIPFILAAAAREVNSLVDKVIGSNLDEGSITILSYASKITVTEVGLIATAVSLVIYSNMSKLNTADNKKGLKESALYGMKFINTLLIPLTVGTVVLKDDLIQALFGRGQFGAESVAVTANVMMIYAIGMMGSGVQDVLMRAMHATKHRKFPASISVIMVIINTVLDLMLYKKYGVYGLAAATTVASLITIVPLFVYFNKTIAKIEKSDGLVKNTICVLLSAMLMGLTVVAINRLLILTAINSILRLIISVLVGVVVYFVMLVLTKNEIILLILSRGKERM